MLSAIELEGRIKTRLVHTGQHYDRSMSGQILQDLGLRNPDDYLDVGSAPASIQIAGILAGLDKLLEQRRPAAVVVAGDVTSTLAGALAAANRSVPLAHVEAGLRSRDWTMPEERNRVLVDRLSRWRFVTEPSGVENLRSEGLESGTHLVGNCMIDSLIQILPAAQRSTVIADLGLEPSGYAILTLHRPATVDHPERLDQQLEPVISIAEEIPVVFPVHPRTRPQLQGRRLPAGLICLDPLGYTDFIGLLSGSVLVMTDSGGIQEETTFLGVPCITLRENTERPVTTEIGTNELAYGDPARVIELSRSAIHGEWKSHHTPELWDGKAAERIASLLLRDLGL